MPSNLFQEGPMLLLEAAAAPAADDVAELAEMVNDISNGFHLHPLLVSLVLSIIALVISRIIVRIIRRALLSVSKRVPKFTLLIAGLVGKIISAFVWIILVVVVLGFFGVDLTPVLAGLGITGVVLGFALQESIASLFSGIMIAINNPFRVGDWVDIGDISGTVTSMDIMCVTLTSGDNKKITMNNRNVWGSTIVNYSYIEKRRLDMTVSVDYSTDTDKAKNVIRALIMSYPEILPDPAPVVAVNNYGASSIDIIVRPYVLPSDYWKVYWRFNADVLRTLRSNGMDMPFNQLVVHMDNGDNK